MKYLSPYKLFELLDDTKIEVGDWILLKNEDFNNYFVTHPAKIINITEYTIRLQFMYDKNATLPDVFNTVGDNIAIFTYKRLIQNILHHTKTKEKMLIYIESKKYNI